MKEVTGGKFEFCGHYNTYSRKFYEDDDGLVIVSNLYALPYLKIFEKEPGPSILTCRKSGMEMAASAGQPDQLQAEGCGPSATRLDPDRGCKPRVDWGIFFWPYDDFWSSGRIQTEWG